MFELIAVFIGGSIGSILRYLLSEYVFNFGTFFLGTLAINIFGCLFLGFVSYFVLNLEDGFNDNLKLFLTTGIAGGFTTFSTFSYEVFNLIQTNQALVGFSYVFVSLFAGLFATLSGLAVAKYANEFVIAKLAYQEEDIEEEADSFEEELYELSVKD